MKDACFRKLQTLRLLPKAPARKSVSQLHDELNHQGFEIDRRSLQRDLKSLANLFEITNDGNKDIPGWYWKKDADKLELPEMEPAVALSFRMMKLFLDKFMPPSTMRELDGYFDRSEQVLHSLKHNHLNDWSNKISVIPRNQPLLSPQVPDEHLSLIYEALLSEVQLKAHYQPRGSEPRDYTINPLGLVIRDQLMYLVCTVWQDKTVKQFALHRFQTLELTDERLIALEDFDLKEYIEQGHFEYIKDAEPMISLKIKINAWLQQHLNESPLNEDQTIEAHDNHFILKATVKNTHQLRWWLLGFGAQVEVIAPQSLRQEFTETAQQLHTQYCTNE